MNEIETYLALGGIHLAFGVAIVLQDELGGLLAISIGIIYIKRGYDLKKSSPPKKLVIGPKQ